MFINSIVIISSRLMHVVSHKIDVYIGMPLILSALMIVVAVLSLFMMLLAVAGPAACTGADCSRDLVVSDRNSVCM